MTYPEDFENLWKLYPKRVPNNNKKKAYRAYCARVKDPQYHGSWSCAVKAYAAYCEATEIIGTRYVMQAATFFGPDEHFLEPWELPKSKLPPWEDEQGWLLLGKQHGLTPRRGESAGAWKNRVKYKVIGE